MTSRKCEQCKHFIIAKAGEGKIYGCDRSKCVFEPTTNNDSGVDCINRDAVKCHIQAYIHEIITESGIDKNAHTNGVLRALLNGVDTIPSVTPQLSVPEVTALAEWTEKLTKECEEAYKKGYADGMKAQAEPKTGHWININVDGFLYHKIYKCSHCGDTVCEHPENIQKYKYCSNCGADMREVAE